MKFSLTILNPEKILYEGDAERVALKGDKGEFELLPYHSPAISILDEGPIVVNRDKVFNISKGLAQFYNNDCIILVEKEKKTGEQKQD